MSMRNSKNKKQGYVSIRDAFLIFNAHYKIKTKAHQGSVKGMFVQKYSSDTKTYFARFSKFGGLADIIVNMDNDNILIKKIADAAYQNFGPPPVPPNGYKNS